MTRRTHLAVVCLALLFVLSLLQGCGGGEEPPQQEVPVPSESQNQEERRESPFEEEIAEIPPPALPAEMEVDTEKDSVTEPVVEAEALGGVDEIIIENQGYREDKKKPVKLGHKKHSEEYEIACNSCHHIYQEGENVWQQGDPVGKCATCHDPVEDQENVIKLQSAFHRNCRDCHKEVALEGRKAPYKKCTDCHQ